MVFGSVLRVSAKRTLSPSWKEEVSGWLSPFTPIDADQGQQP
jgi:hypothetical protein